MDTRFITKIWNTYTASWPFILWNSLCVSDVKINDTVYEAGMIFWPEEILHWEGYGTMILSIGHFSEICYQKLNSETSVSTSKNMTFCHALAIHPRLVRGPPKDHGWRLSLPCSKQVSSINTNWQWPSWKDGRLAERLHAGSEFTRPIRPQDSEMHIQTCILKAMLW
jgi:hypothetical protein